MYSKNDIERSRKDLLDTINKYRLSSYEDEMICPNHLKIDNTHLSPEEVANQVIEEFDLLNGINL